MANKVTVFGAVLTLVAFGAAAALYDKLPEVLPVHWGLKGEANGFMAKPWGVYLYPAMIGIIFLLKLVLPAISPRAFAIEPFGRTFNIIMAALMLFSAYLMGVVYASALGAAQIPVGRAVIGGIGILFVVLGNLFGKVTRNFFVGIRTPWTLASDDVWFKTHRLGGWLIVLAGLTTLAVALLGAFYVAALVMFAAAVLVPIVYSFVLSRQIDHASR